MDADGTAPSSWLQLLIRQWSQNIRITINHPFQSHWTTSQKLLFSIFISTAAAAIQFLVLPDSESSWQYLFGIPAITVSTLTGGWLGAIAALAASLGIVQIAWQVPITHPDTLQFLLTASFVCILSAAYEASYWRRRLTIEHILALKNQLGSQQNLVEALSKTLHGIVYIIDRNEMITPLVANGPDTLKLKDLLFQHLTVDEFLERFQTRKNTGSEYAKEDLTMYKALQGESIVERLQAIRVRGSTNSRWQWKMANAEPIRGDNGEIIGAVAAFRDVTAQKEAEEQSALLVGELSHRMKNLLAVVESMILLTSEEKKDEAFASNLAERIRGLSRNIEILTKADWVQIPLLDLVKQQLEPFVSETSHRLIFAGPDVNISSTAAEVLGMALHELATNALKYGALSTEDGVIEITWSVEQTPQVKEANLIISWHERDGPTVVKPTTAGFGRVIICEIPEHRLGAAVSYTFEPNGIRWQLKAPLKSMIANSGQEGGVSQ